MSTIKRRCGYLATAEGAKKLTNAKDSKGCTYDEIATGACETKDKVKRLFNPQWGNGKYKVGRDAVIGICRFLDLSPEEIVSNWYPVEINSKTEEVVSSTQVQNHVIAYYKALEKIDKALVFRQDILFLRGMELVGLPS